MQAGGGDKMAPIPMYGYWFAEVSGRLIKCESYEEAAGLMDE